MKREKEISKWVNNTSMKRWWMISPQKFRFIHVPKVAGMAIRKALTPYGLERVRDCNKKVKKGNSKCLEEYVNLPSFAFVRNPWDRMVSAYFCGQKHLLYVNTKKEKIKVKGRTFEDFVLKLSWIDGVPTNDHWRPQMDFIKYKDKFIVDYIGRFENLDSDFKKACRHIQVSEDILLAKQNQTVHKNFEEFYEGEIGKKMSDFIQERYSDEIKEFGYTSPREAKA